MSGSLSLGRCFLITRGEKAPKNINREPKNTGPDIKRICQRHFWEEKRHSNQAKTEAKRHQKTLTKQRAPKNASSLPEMALKNGPDIKGIFVRTYFLNPPPITTRPKKRRKNDRKKWPKNDQNMTKKCHFFGQVFSPYQFFHFALRGRGGLPLGGVPKKGGGGTGRGCKRNLTPALSPASLSISLFFSLSLSLALSLSMNHHSFNAPLPLPAVEGSIVPQHTSCISQSQI